MDVEKGAYILLVIAVMGVALVIVAGINYTNYAKNIAQVNTSATFAPVYNIQNVGPSANAVNDIGANALTLAITGAGGTSWITSANQIKVTVSGYIVSAYSTSNTVYATPGTANTQTFTLNYYSGTNTLCSGCGNFYNITSVSVSGINNYGASPGLSFAVTQTFIQYVHGSVPQTITVNTISASTSANVLSNIGVNANFTTNGGAIANTSSSNSNYAYYILFMALILAIIIGALVHAAKTKS